MKSANAAAGDGGSRLRRQLHLTMRQAQELEIGREVARGGMGAVRTAHESATRRTVAVKVMLHPDNPQDAVRFITEARITAQLEHPNIVPIYDLGLDPQGKPFYTMKLVEGITLMRILQLLQEGVPETVARYPLTTLLTIFQKLCDALAFAHARGVIHRDLKPANIMLGKYGEVLVMDWGLAKIIGAKQPASPEDVDSSAETALSNPRFGEEESLNTHAGAILGTPHYMSPEQARGEIEQLDARSDIFVLGLILYEILTLERAFSGNRTNEILAKIAGFTGPLPMMQTRIAHLPGGVVPESLAAVVHKATAAGQGPALRVRHRPPARHRSVSKRLCHQRGERRDRPANPAARPAPQGRLQHAGGRLGDHHRAGRLVHHQPACQRAGRETQRATRASRKGSRPAGLRPIANHHGG